MKKKGFTLIELLGVIIILSILSLIVFPLLLKQVNKSKEEIEKVNEVLILDAAKDYVFDNENSFKKINGNSYCISIENLIKGNYLNPNIKDSNNNRIDLNKMIEINYNENKFTYKITNKNTCVEKQQ